jgi:hypothetical protein
VLLVLCTACCAALCAVRRAAIASQSMGHCFALSCEDSVCCIVL